MQRGNSDEKTDAKARRLANLKPFKKGQSGNPLGRPKSAAYPHALRRMMNEVDPDDAEGRTYAEVLAETAIKKAKTDIRYLAHVADRVYGKSRQLITLNVQQKEKYERVVEGIMGETGCSREEAVRTLSNIEPEIDFSELLIG
jgi:hypothetical protein